MQLAEYLYTKLLDDRLVLVPLRKRRELKALLYMMKNGEGRIEVDRTLGGGRRYGIMMYGTTHYFAFKWKNK